MSFDIFGVFAQFRTAIIVGALALSVGFGGGIYTAHKFAAANEVSALEKDVKVSASNIVESHAASVGIEAKVDSGKAVATKIQSAAAQRITNQQERINEDFARQIARQVDKASSQAPVCPAFVLDVGTLGLLNAAREGTAVEPTGGSDEALNAPSAVGVKKLVDNDLEIVKQYHELATRHDALVDAVEKKLKEQAQ